MFVHFSYPGRAQVGLQIIDMFQSDGKADQALADAAALRCASVKRPCGCLPGVMVVLVSPRLAVMLQMRVLSIT